MARVAIFTPASFRQSNKQNNPLINDITVPFMCCARKSLLRGS